MIPKGKLSAASNQYRCLVFSSVGAFTDMTDTPPGGNVVDPELQIICLVLEEGISVYRNLVLCVKYC